MSAPLLLLLALVAPARAGRVDLTESMERFAAQDKNRDGALSAAEIVEGAAAEHKAMDLDGDGIVTAAKDRPAGEEPAKADPTQKPHPLDSNHDAGVSLLEFTRGAVARARVADSDGDGKVTRREWLADEGKRLRHLAEEAELRHESAPHEKPAPVKKPAPKSKKS